MLAKHKGEKNLKQKNLKNNMFIYYIWKIKEKDWLLKF